MREVPRGFTGLKAHNLPSLAGVRFYEECEIVDAEDPNTIYRFSLQDPAHGACFYLKMGEWLDYFRGR